MGATSNPTRSALMVALTRMTTLAAICLPMPIQRVSAHGGVAAAVGGAVNLGVQLYQNGGTCGASIWLKWVSLRFPALGLVLWADMRSTVYLLKHF